jgi:hypothetical protein
LNVPTDSPWPYSPEDFEDLLTRIVTPPQPELTEEEIDELIDDWQRRNPPKPTPAPREELERPGPYDRGGSPDLFPY